MTDFVRTCKKCNKKVPAREVRLQADGSYVCFSCAGYQTPTSKDTAHSDAPAVHKTRYQCAKCKYEFWLKDGHAKQCPYCSGSNVEEKTGHAQKLLDMHVPFRDRDDE